MKSLAIITACCIAFAAPATVRAEDFKATLIGYEEVPAVSTIASGEFRAKLDKKNNVLNYELTYSDVQGTVQQAHIHFGQAGVNGSIVIWLCQTATTPAPAAVSALTPFCPQSGTVTGTISAANVIAAGTASQRILAGELDEVIDAMEAGVAYANVHATPLNPGGEIRGQIRK
jgi:hypothetical protein